MHDVERDLFAAWKLVSRVGLHTTWVHNKLSFLSLQCECKEICKCRTEVLVPEEPQWQDQGCQINYFDQSNKLFIYFQDCFLSATPDTPLPIRSSTKVGSVSILLVFKSLVPGAVPGALQVLTECLGNERQGCFLKGAWAQFWGWEFL